MKKFIFCFLVAMLILSCATTRAQTTTIRESANEIAQDFSDVIGKEWKLIEVHIDGIRTPFTRDGQPAGLRDIYTLNFDAQTVSGTGAPNRYSAPYTLSENQGISLLPMRSTLMASIFEPENLSEHTFYSYLQNASSWRLVDGKLEIHATNDERPVRLVFGL